MAAAAVSSAFDLGGASLVVDAACASALLALHEAVVHLRAGHCDLAIAGGVYLNLVPDNLVAFSRIGAVSPRGACRPFDRRADGFVLGEGAGVVVLKRLADAVAAGDGVYAVIRGIGCSNDGRAEGPMTPRLGGQVASLRRAYRDADVDPATVGFVECHGTATPAGDATELAALREVFGQDASAQVSSVKANIGHTMSAAGIAGLIKAVLVLRHGTVPPQVGCDDPDPALGTFRISRAAQPWTVSSDALRRAGVSSFGFGGTNVHVVLEEAADAVSGPRPLPHPAPRPETARYWAVRQGPLPLAPHAAPQLPAPQAGAGHAVSSPLLAAIAEVSAHAPDSLRPDRALVDDLGFDSLMLVELEEHLTRTFPDLGRLPENLMRRSTTIADLDAWLARHLGARPGRHLDVRPAVTPTGAPDGPAGAAPAANSQERPRKRVARLRANTELFRRRATEAGLEVGPGPAPVVPFLTGTSASALLLADRMRQRGVNVQPIVYPAVPDAAARLRFFLNASHTDAHIDEAVAILAQETDGQASAASRGVPKPSRGF